MWKFKWGKKRYAPHRRADSTGSRYCSGVVWRGNDDVRHKKGTNADDAE